MQDERRITIRLPGKLKDWLDQFADEEGSSVNFEIVRSVRERMNRMQAATGEGLVNHAPAAAPITQGCEGAPNE